MSHAMPHGPIAFSLLMVAVLWMRFAGRRALHSLALQHHLRLRHDRGELAVAARDARLQHDGGAAACSGMHSACATSPIGMPAKKLVLLSIVVVRWPSLQVRVRGRAAEAVGEGHHGAAMHHAAAVLELLAHGKLGLQALGRDLIELDAEEIGKGRLRDGGFDGQMVLGW